RNSWAESVTVSSFYSQHSSQPRRSARKPARALPHETRQRLKARELAAQACACGRLADMAQRVKRETELRAQQRPPIAAHQRARHVLGPHKQKVAPAVI